jgi:hypothetical protein
MTKTEIENKPKMTRSQAGRLGALALAANPTAKSTAAKKAAAKRKAKDPDAYRKMGKKGGGWNRSHR